MLVLVLIQKNKAKTKRCNNTTIKTISLQKLKCQVANRNFENKRGKELKNLIRCVIFQHKRISLTWFNNKSRKTNRYLIVRKCRDIVNFTRIFQSKTILHKGIKLTKKVKKKDKIHTIDKDLAILPVIKINLVYQTFVKSKIIKIYKKGKIKILPVRKRFSKKIDPQLPSNLRKINKINLGITSIIPSKMYLHWKHWTNLTQFKAKISKKVSKELF